MPANLINKVVDVCGISEKEAEDKWEEAKKSAIEKGFAGGSDRFYIYTTGVFKKMVGAECAAKMGWDRKEEGVMGSRAERLMSMFEITKPMKKKESLDEDLGKIPCTVCGYVGIPKAAVICPECGSPMKKKKVKEELDEGVEEYRAAAKKMVAGIEKRRKDGKYSEEERQEMEDKFYANIVKVANP